MPIRSFKDMVAEAALVTEAITPAQAVAQLGQSNVVFVDVREQSELDATGTIQGAVHVPRGLLESKTDPTSPLHEPALSSCRRLITFCASGARAALSAKTLSEMGVVKVSHVHGGGFDAMREAGAGVILAKH